MQTITYQPALRPALPCIYGPLEYREQRDLYERIDGILKTSGLEHEFINLAVPYRKFDCESASVKQVDGALGFKYFVILPQGFLIHFIITVPDLGGK